MSLTDRLAAARGRSTETIDAPAPGDAGPAGGAGDARARRRQQRPRADHRRDQAQGRRRAKIDPFDDLKRIVHARLVETLGPKLYDVHMTQSELEQQVRLALQTAIADDRHRRCRRPTAPGSPRRSPTTSSATARSSRCCATPSLSEVMVNAYDGHLRRAQRQAGQGRHRVHRRGAPAPHDRQDRQQDRPTRRRDQPHGATRASPTAAASTRSSRRWRSTAPSSPSASSPRTPTPSRT